MSTEIKQAVWQRIKAYDRIVLMRHKRPDGDAVGATLGLRDLLRATFPHKDVRVVNIDTAPSLAFLGKEDTPFTPEEYTDALGIVIDAATRERIANPSYQICRELIKIDHHLPVDVYGDLAWVEPQRSSACEMITELYDTFSDEITLPLCAATALYTGMVSDSGSFRYQSVSPRTLTLAAVLLARGVDKEQIYARLYLREPNTYRYQSFVYQNMSITENGVGYVRVTEAVRAQFALTDEQVGEAVNFMDSMRGVLVWMAFIDNPDGSMRVRMRSRFLPINGLAERYSGGGHANASGATVKDAREMAHLVADADELVRAFKQENSAWL